MNELNITCLLDVDNMTEFNLVNSFAVGDELLKEIDEVGCNCKDIIFWQHMTSDEFIFQCKSKETIFLLISTIENRLEITVSIGALCGSRIANPNNIDSITISILKTALLQAKLNSKYKVCIYEIRTD